MSSFYNLLNKRLEQEKKEKTIDRTIENLEAKIEFGEHLADVIDKYFVDVRFVVDRVKLETNILRDELRVLERKNEV